MFDLIKISDILEFFISQGQRSISPQSIGGIFSLVIHSSNPGDSTMK